MFGKVGGVIGYQPHAVIGAGERGLAGETIGAEANGRARQKMRRNVTGYDGISGVMYLRQAGSGRRRVGGA